MVLLKMQKKVSLILFCFFGVIEFTFAQQTDSEKSNSYLSGAAGITNNGISLIPTFSLGKPAAIFDMSMVKSKFSFDPELTFSLKGKPWYFLFWFRYQLVTNDRFQIHVGSHLGLNFKNTELPIDGDSTEVTITERYLAGELSMNYFLTKNISIGIYYLYSHGLDPTTVKNDHFITANANFSNIKLSSEIYMGIAPQFYYLNQGEHDGFYFTSAFSLNKRNFPLSISSIINKAIQTNIPSKDFVWNVTLTYSFNKRYFVAKKNER
jgi:hypothetical protein